MKVIHCADLHLGFENEKLNLDNNHYIAAFEQVIDYARKHDICHIIIAGDLFDRESNIDVVKNMVEQRIERNADIFFYYLRGVGHDQYVELKEFPNLKVFKIGELTSYDVEEDVSISGYEMSTNEDVYTGIYRKIKFLSPDKYNILIMHGDICNNANSLSLEKGCKVNITALKESSINYLALGHYHYFSSGKLNNKVAGTYVMPGCIEGHDFGKGELNEKYFIVLDTEKNNFEKISIKAPKYITVKIDCSETSGINDIKKKIINIFNQQNLEILNYDEVFVERNFIKPYDFVRLELFGEVEYSITDKDISILKSKDMIENVKIIDVVDNTKPIINLNIDEGTLSHQFLNLVENDATLDDEEKRKIQSLGLKCLKELKRQ